VCLGVGSEDLTKEDLRTFDEMRGVYTRGNRKKKKTFRGERVVVKNLTG